MTPSRKSKLSRTLCVAAAVLLCLPWAEEAISAPVPHQEQAMSILRVLAYDRNLRKRAGESVHVVIVYRAGDASSEAAQAELSAAIAQLARSTLVNSLPVQFSAVAYSDAKSLEAKVQEQKASVIYLCTGLQEAVPSIVGVSRRLLLRSFAGDESYVRSGAGVGFVKEGGKVRYFVNLNASRAEGADLSSNFLRLAEIVG